MKKWLQKGLMVSVALLTFGIIAPNHAIWNQSDQDDGKVRSHEPGANDLTAAIQLDQIYIEEETDVLDLETVGQTFKSAAKEQAYIKFGTRIAPVIGDEFETRIFPKMEEAIDFTLARLDDDTMRTLTITEKPSGHYSEKIFHIKNTASKEDVIRFHVRTENRLDAGYYYNFHYHTFEDDFVTHYDLGEIYWSKNTPPKWLS
ncbi:YpjP family protein [Lysinibacillus sp. LZ02]|uniref:YpjP family protein n=1 Tax=Lysinibacillus sp. LZ02 TaxID=3420668 RepID=UPI003D35DB15